jgi:shikimate kinase|tara:strand:+ start:49 stop:531 length:483 start_codon:yes stop_codon:yes gene_type:complete
MMGVGKTTVGKALSEHLSMEFLDVDTIIEKKLNLTVQKIFEKNGEAFFREVEEEVTLQTLKDKNKIISLGGGAFMNPKIRDCVISNTKSYWLYLDLNLLEKRLINSRKRPLLINKNIRLDLEKIYNERKGTYSLANYKIDCNNLSTDLITKKIITLYEDN